MRIIFKITRGLLDNLREDLARPHAFAAERVGFLSCRAAKLAPSGLVILAREYHAVADSDYIEDSRVGAMMNSEAIRKAMQVAYSNGVGVFHVHMHDHYGRPGPSKTDLRETSKFVPDFWHVRPQMPHGAVIISRDGVSGRCWYPGHRVPCEIDEFVVVGPKLDVIRSSKCTTD
jgi:hypothetical protein